MICTLSLDFSDSGNCEYGTNSSGLDSFAHEFLSIQDSCTSLDNFSIVLKSKTFGYRPCFSVYTLITLSYTKSITNLAAS